MGLKREVAAAALLLATMAVPACDEKLAELAGPSPALTPTFASIQQEIFSTTDHAGRTACVNCHTNVGRTPAGGLNLASNAYANLVDVPSRGRPDLKLVAPGDPENSYLVHKLEGRPGIVGLRMPRNSGPFLTSGQMIIIKRWIELGAQND
jgi:hypothetical protein